MNAPERIALETKKLLEQVVVGSIATNWGQDQNGYYLTISRRHIGVKHVVMARLNVTEHETADRKINTEVRKAATTATANFLKAQFLDNKEDAIGRDAIYSLPDTQQQASSSLSRYHLGGFV